MNLLRHQFLHFQIEWRFTSFCLSDPLILLHDTLFCSQDEDAFSTHYPLPSCILLMVHKVLLLEQNQTPECFSTKVYKFNQTSSHFPHRKEP